MAKSTFYSDTGGDGSVFSEDADWTTARDAATGAVYEGPDDVSVISDYFGSNYRCERIFLPFDTSSLPNDDVITAVHLKVYVASLFSNTNGILGLIQTTQASISALATTDYNNIGSTEGATRLTVSKIGWYTFVLNEVGINWVSKTGNTKLGIRTALDIDNTIPVDGSNETAIWIKTNEHASLKPQLIVTHYPVAESPIGFLSGKKKSGGFLTGSKQESKKDALKKSGGFLTGYKQHLKHDMIRKAGGFLGGSKKEQ